MYYLFVINMPPSTLIQSVGFKPSKRKGVFYEMSSTCPVCKLKCSRKGVMLRHKRNKHGSTHPYPQSSDVYPPLRRTLLYFENQQSLHILRFRRIRSRSFHAVGPSIYHCNLGTNRKWKIRICQEIRTQYQTHDDPNTGSLLVVLWRIPDCIRNRRWGELSTRIAGLEHPRPQRKNI